ncbi:putative arabinose 5-phosphate isomerase-like [Capsicum annuum]|uniref:suppressor protein SRP40 isoform X1 n=1 Tax=Capsicum annuum TaxID=4072 RepID=UPI001FB0A88A|nr:suppressor protein SRP40 isoform X1 [Capsicum annuum]XP_016564007.2 suppressor protein SRP40 isoform X1 [Capsicum annuum]XP_047265538.1 suppressor protein SRP40 isoform X1 [Capsicum annuum]XP_047265539.1 suppressor protein SRP40 isoform X1 [Capsicum annuum]KAF3658169.1 putative arabinose 5-phosphate isomerase-like [Capsicum annuum]
MNAQLNSTANFIQENAAGSDSDSNSDDSPEYYQPISSTADEDDPHNSDHEDSDESSDVHRLPNGYANCVENGISSSPDLSDEDEESEEAEEERIRTASDTAVRRAFTEDESRRNTPLTAENATRVMEAMRRISFGGVAPDWTSQVPEDQWIEHLQTLRRSPATATSTN